MMQPPRLRLLRLVPALALAGSLAGCGGGLSRTFGFSRSSPDEFAVTTQPPLSMPPDYAIRAPAPGAPRPQQVSASAAAAAALGTSPQAKAGASSAGQQALLQAAARSAGTAAGRQIASPPASNTSFVKALLFGGANTGKTQEVNAPAEAARLRHNAALGQGATQGPTPTIRPASGGWFSHLF